MIPMVDRKPSSSVREYQLARSAQRSELRLAYLRNLEKRFAWYRLLAFGVGSVASWLALTRLSTPIAFLVIGLAVGLFTGVLALHRRLNRWIERFSIWKDLRLTQLARLSLDWERIPPARPYAGPRSSLDVDLDLTGPNSLHQLLDLSISADGNRLLADWLVHLSADLAQIAERQVVVRELASLPRFRDRLLLNLQLISKEQLKGQSLLNWLKIDVPARRLKWLFGSGSLLLLAAGLLFVLNYQGVLPIYWPFPLAVYAYLYFSNSGMINRFLQAVVELDSELDKFRSIVDLLERFPLTNKPHLAQLCSPFREPERLPSAELRRIKLVTAAVGLRSNPVLGLLLNIFSPWDFFWALLAERLRRPASRDFPVWLETFYQLEALTSLANLAYLNPDYTFPVVRAGAQPVFQAEELGHPLIPPERRVCNDFTINELGQVMIITGSNMSGKSTFIKTIGINLVLALCGGPVNAAYLGCQPFRLATCMRITDSISDGFSYFYAEVKSLKGLMDSLRAENQLPLLYLVDEIFRGTNNRERLIGSRAYVQALIGANGVGLIATHDLELASLAETSPLVSNYHFRDRVEERRLVFDYKLQPGASPTTNALKIMEMEGLPIKS